MQITQLLLQARPNLDLPNKVRVTKQPHYLTHFSIIIFQSGWTPLMSASFENRDKVVQLLVSAGATVDLVHRVCE